MTFRGIGSEFDKATARAVAAGIGFLSEPLSKDKTFIFNTNEDAVLLRFDPKAQTPSVKDLSNAMNQAAGGMENYSGSKAFEHLQNVASKSGRDVTRTAIRTPAEGDKPEKMQPVIVIGPVVR